MKKTILAIALMTMIAGSAFAGPLRCVFFVFRKTWLDANPDKFRKGCCWIWQQDQATAPESITNGVQWYYYNGNTNVMVGMYWVTEYQIKQVLTPEKRDALLAYLNNNPDVDARPFYSEDEATNFYNISTIWTNEAP